ncbi:transglutaminase-like domain-containing protein [Cupriavidus agavae]|uniref:Transglutaminase-like putative cysteine protease n=1 Tax=Cupriavidus agavae TaxID=1001822 RepID=A0A4Q7R9Y1_9BURK|nr:transglutaminase family protein [Cupriavidus agavae]RZT28998.1 transglutaminase-like putative cysteine protease [Cupriavidus agavae]
MDRRNFLRLGAAVPVSIGAAGIAPAFSATAAQDSVSASDGWRVYEMTTEVVLPGSAGPATVWLPVTARSLGDYQRTLSSEWIAPGAQARAARAGRYGVDIVVVDWPQPTHGAPLTARMVNTVALRDRDVDLGAAPSRAARESAAAQQEYLRPTQLMPTDGIVRKTALAITAGMTDDMTKAQAIYQWVVDHTCRDSAVRGCGTGDVVTMLKTGGIMNGKCADINGLFVALARAAGIPARDAYGVRVDNSALGFKALGKAGDISKAQHCRAEFYAAGLGWIPVDPADVRKVALEEVPGGLPMTDAKVRAARAMLFGAWEGNWVAYNHGHDVRLPGGTTQVPFLMYPQGKTTAGMLDSLDPAAFGYRITSRRVA